MHATQSVGTTVAHNTFAVGQITVSASSNEPRLLTLIASHVLQQPCAIMQQMIATATCWCCHGASTNRGLAPAALWALLSMGGSTPHEMLVYFAFALAGLYLSIW
jgi:hypothetical protein